MDNREWMYTGWLGKRDWTEEFVHKVDEFLKKAFEKGQSKVLCLCSQCQNKKFQSQFNMDRHICNYGFVANYTRWTCHGEAYRARDEVMRQCIQTFDDEAGVGDMLHDYGEAHIDDGPGGRRSRRHPQRLIMKCCQRHNDHFMGIPGFLNWMPLHD